MISAKNEQGRERWIQARQVAYWGLTPHLKRSSKVTDLGKFDWEVKKGAFAKLKKVSQADIDAQAQLMLQMFETNSKREVN